MKKIENKTDTMKQIETKLGGDIEEVLRHLYVDRDLSVMRISQILGISYVTTHKWLKLSGVRSRKIEVGS